VHFAEKNFCANCLLTNPEECGIMAGRWRTRRPEFGLNQQFSNFKIKKLFSKKVLTNPVIGGII
jgi:hypothetical protein